MDLKTSSKRINISIPHEDYADLLYEAAERGLPIASYARQILITRGGSAPGNAIAPPVINRDLAKNLATAIAIIIVTGAVTTEGLEDLLERTTLDIMKSLGAA